MNNITHMPYFLLHKAPNSKQSRLFIVDDNQVKTELDIQLPFDEEPFTRFLTQEEKLLQLTLKKLIEKEAEVDDFFLTLECSLNSLVGQLIAVRAFNPFPQINPIPLSKLEKYDGLPAFTLLSLGPGINQNRTILLSKAEQGFISLSITKSKNGTEVNHVLTLPI